MNMQRYEAVTEIGTERQLALLAGGAVAWALVAIAATLPTTASIIVSCCAAVVSAVLVRLYLDWLGRAGGDA